MRQVKCLRFNQLDQLTFAELRPKSEEYSEKDFSLMQFTGLLDKNGKEIYQDDIIRTDKGVKYRVIWSNTSAGFVVVTENKWVKPHNQQPLLYQKMRWVIEKGGEVIGNFYKHPNLLN